MKAAACARSITDTHAVERQVEEIRRFIAGRGWTLVATYSDLTSGTRNNRAGFRQLLAAAARGHFDAVIVQGLDRAREEYDRAMAALARHPTAPLVHGPNTSRGRPRQEPPLRNLDGTEGQNPR